MRVTFVSGRRGGEGNHVDAKASKSIFPVPFCRWSWMPVTVLAHLSYRIRDFYDFIILYITVVCHTNTDDSLNTQLAEI